MSGTSAPLRIGISPIDHQLLPVNLRRRIQARRADLMAGLVYASDWADYKQRVGVINGLDEAIMACQEIEKDMNGER